MCPMNSEGGVCAQDEPDFQSSGKVAFSLATDDDHDGKHFSQQHHIIYIIVVIIIIIIITQQQSKRMIDV